MIITNDGFLSQRDEDYVIALKNKFNKIIGGVSWNQINQPYQKYLFDNTNVQIYFGGGSSGKSHFVFQRTILDVWLNGRNFLIARQKKNSLENSVYTELIRKINDFGLNNDFEWKKNPMSITCTKNNRQILFVGLDDIESVKSIVPRDGTFTDVIVEEATEIRESDFDQLRIRQRGICYRKNGNELTNEELIKRTTIMFNPINKSHWIFKRFFVGKFDDDDKEVHYEERVEYDALDDKGVSYKEVGIETFGILKTTYRDNKFLSQDDIIKLENTKDPVQRDVYVNGNWGSLGKTVYQKGKNWFVEDLTDKISTFTNIRNGLDFGGAIDPHAYTKSSIDKENKIIYIFDEFKANEIDVDELWYNIRGKCGTMPIICDRNEDMIKQLRQCGANPYRARKGQNSIINGINWLRSYKIVVDKKCRETMFEFENYTWKTDRYGQPMEVPIDKENHLCLTGDTIIKTLDGDFRIDELVGKKGKFTYCYDVEDGEITSSEYFNPIMTSESEEIYELELENGYKLKGTYNHPILTDNGWKKMGELTEDDVVLCLSNEKTKISYSDDFKYAYYDGIKFTKDEKSNYYLNSTIHKRLHRYVYEKECGRIKRGYEIHHIDFNKRNNDISNLLCLCKKNHVKIHSEKNKSNPLFIENAKKRLFECNYMAKEWHKSEIGKEWHKNHFKNMKDKMFIKREYVCIQCGTKFETTKVGSKYCSNKCKSKYRRDNGLDDIKKICINCGKEFYSNKYAKTKYCSKKCSYEVKSKKFKKVEE